MRGRRRRAPLTSATIAAPTVRNPPAADAAGRPVRPLFVAEHRDRRRRQSPIRSTCRQPQRLDNFAQYIFADPLSPGLSRAINSLHRGGAADESRPASGLGTGRRARFLSQDRFGTVTNRPEELRIVRHEQLWAPWRLGYIKGEEVGNEKPELRTLDFLPGADPKCFVCHGVADRADRENLIVNRGKRTIVFLNRYPYNNGHLLVAPLSHKARLDELDDAEQLECQQVLSRLVGKLEKLINAEGFNIGLNLGRTAGAGLPGHLHWHIVPRWNGDTNFMPVLAGTRVIPQALDAMWELLSENP